MNGGIDFWSVFYSKSVLNSKWMSIGEDRDGCFSLKTLEFYNSSDVIKAVINVADLM